MLVKSSKFLSRPFFSRPTIVVARELLGCELIREFRGIQLSGIIIETEAYIGETDLACHARAGRTNRTQFLYGSPGHTYIYFTYGMHWMLNIVTERKNFPAAVLIRSITPKKGIESMKRFRSGKPLTRLTNGPAKLTQAMNITKKQNGIDCCNANSIIKVKRGSKTYNSQILKNTRIGLGQTPEPWFSKPWRFNLKDISKP
ncbi:MAG: DNA-3-methyladenine glycosylase [Acidobacteriia bacterium]|nr:DNA-3-methyladenine glycosylase [Terriglobia bacterium]